MPINDIQYDGPNGVADLKRLGRHLAWGMEHGALFIGLGDFIDFMSPSNREKYAGANLYTNARETVDRMAGILEDELMQVLAPTRGRWIGLLQGHHFFEHLDGTSSDTRFAAALDTRYLGDSVLGRIRFRDEHGGSAAIKVFAHHGAGGTTGQGAMNKLKKQKAAYPGVRLFIQGHIPQLPHDQSTELDITDHDEPIIIATDTHYAVCGGFARSFKQGSEFAGRKQGCVPMDTQMLTRRGFRSANELIIGEEVTAFDETEHILRWTPLRAVQTYPDTEIWKVGSSQKGGLGVWATGEHRWFIETEKGVEKVLTTEEIRRVRLRMAAPLEQDTDHSELTPQEAAILGWIVTDGGFYPWSSQAFIAQKKYVHEVRVLLDGVGSETIGTKGCTYFNLPFEFTDLLFARAGVQPWTFDGIDRLVSTLTPDARASMKIAMEQVEGYFTGEGRGWRFYQKRAVVLQAWEILCTLAGERLGVLRVNKDGVSGRRNILGQFGSVSSPIEREVAEVWCPTTDYGSWVLRQADGAITITGNSYAEKAMLAPATIGGAVIRLKPENQFLNGRRVRTVDVKIST